MSRSFTGRKRIRRTFGRIPEVTQMPNLIEVQKQSYDHFLQMDVPPADRESVGLEEVFSSVFPIMDFSERAELHRAAATCPVSQTLSRNLEFSCANTPV